MQDMAKTIIQSSIDIDKIFKNFINKKGRINYPPFDYFLVELCFSACFLEASLECSFALAACPLAA